MRKIFCKDTPEALQEIRAALMSGESVEVHNEYETVYGVGFDGWLRKGIADLNCTIEEKGGRQREYDYAWTYLITPVQETRKVDDKKLDEIQSKLRKLQKLYEGAKAINSEEEANNAASKIQHLLALYNLSMAEVGVEPEKNVVIQQNASGCDFKSIGGKWEMRLYDVLCKYNFCRCFMYGNSYKNLLLIGKKENLDMVKWMKDVLAKKYVELSNDKWNAYKQTQEFQFNPISKDRYQRSFLLGCCKGLNDKLRIEREKDKVDTEIGTRVTSLIVRTDAELDDYVKNAWGHVGTRHSNDRVCGTAHSSGYEAGRNTTIGKPISCARETASRTHLLGA